MTEILQDDENEEKDNSELIGHNNYVRTLNFEHLRLKVESDDHHAYLGFSMVMIMMRLYFLAWLLRMEMTK